MTDGSKGQPGSVITQRDLKTYLSLKHRLVVLKRRFAKKRLRLIRLVDGNAPVEPGRLGIDVEPYTQRRITKAFLVAVLGEVGYEDMRSEAPPTVYRRLVIDERDR